MTSMVTEQNTTNNETTITIHATIISTKGTLKLKKISGMLTFQQFKEEIIKQLFSITNMQPKYLRMLINGKEIADMNAKLITLNVKNKKIMKIKVNILFTEQFHLMKDKEKKKMLEKDATIKSNNNSIKDDNNESNRIAMTNTKSKNKSETYHIEGNNDESKMIAAILIILHGTNKYTIQIHKLVTLLDLKLKLIEILGISSTKRLKLIAKGKILTDDGMIISNLSNSSSNKKKIKIRLLHDETYYTHEEGISVLEKVLKSLEQTKRNVHSLYSQLAHNFYDKAKMTLQRGSYDDQLEILKRNLQSIKVKEEDKGKVENALKELEKIYEENEKINSILAKRN